jgi:hypothetical protein
VAVVLLQTSSVLAQTNQEQAFQLAQGWNLIAFQVLPDNPSPSAVFSSLGLSFESAWSYNNSNKRWTLYNRPGLGRPEDNSIAAMTAIEIGRLIGFT